MAKQWLFIFCAFAFVGVNADDLSNFSNNLFTDIGPLLALFGEAMTTQYLSESTSFLDYFVFAMAPIGILTAIFSAIRVCGHSSLRAFIGRSQEGEGVVEAELCTSTSRDVCELFNRGGITRVLGRPSILELVYLPHNGGPEAQDRDSDKAGLFLFRNYLEAHADLDTSGWKKAEGSVLGRWGKQASPTVSFAPNPNLLLNVGIVKRSWLVFFAVAAVGFVLQAGVLALAGSGVWILQWNVSGGDGPDSTSYAPAMFIAGTVLVCSGMWRCAALIGQTTHELYYKRQSQPRRSRLLWLQPGPQVIGDQSFDSFAYLESEDDPLKVWTSSTKDFKEKFELYTLFAVSAVLIGYIMQFIGLRGMSAWVSLAQLGATIIMSILRGFLRMERLHRDANKLGNMPDLVMGHELDWLAFKIAQLQQGSCWHVTGKHEKAEFETESSSTKASGSHETSSRDNKGVQLYSENPLASTSRPHSPTTSQNGLGDYKDLLPIRVRLAHLTGHFSFRNLENGEYQKWKDDYVKVRKNAGKLSDAVCLAAASLVPKNLAQKKILLRVTAISTHNGSTVDPHAQLISIVLKPPSESSQADWKVDSARLEAILGLWMWSLMSDERLQIRDDAGHLISLAEGTDRSRIISAGPDGESWNHKTNKQAEMDLWLGPDAVGFSDTTLTLDKSNNYGLINVWKSASGEEPIGGLRRKGAKSIERCVYFVG